MPLLTSILFLLVLSRLLGELFERLGQPAIVGEIFAGILLGPGILNLIQPTEHLAGIAELSVFLIVLSAGLEMEFRDVIRAFSGKGLIIACTGFFLPLVSGMALGALFGFDSMRIVFLGLCMSITALPVAIRILESFGILKTAIARYSIATAILNDIAALLCLGVILDMPSGSNEKTTWDLFRSLLLTSGKLAIFGVIVALTSRLIRWGSGQNRWIERQLEKVLGFFGREALFGIAVLFVLIFASIGESLGSHFVIGAFFGALMLSKDVFGSSLFTELENVLNSLTSGFLGPLFFGFLGLHFSFGALRSPILVLAVLAVSILSKVYSGVIAGKLVGLKKEEALGIGIILNGRGIMELVVANIALQLGFIEKDLFSILVLMGVTTTILTPSLFRKWVLPRLKSDSIKVDEGGANLSPAP